MVLCFVYEPLFLNECPGHVNDFTVPMMERISTKVLSDIDNNHFKYFQQMISLTREN